MCWGSIGDLGGSVDGVLNLGRSIGLGSGAAGGSREQKRAVVGFGDQVAFRQRNKKFNEIDREAGLAILNDPRFRNKRDSLLSSSPQTDSLLNTAG